MTRRSEDDMVDFNEFRLEGKVVSTIPYGEGHINRTYSVITDCGRKYILQRINDSIFPDVPALMRNITLVTDHLRKKTTDRRKVMEIIRTADGGSYVKGSDGYYRMYSFVKDTVCLQSIERPQDFYESALAFGSFSNDLSDFDASLLTEVIPDFHNTPKRYRDFKSAVEKDAFFRAGNVKREIDFILEREDKMSQLQKMRQDGTLPLRVTHNDTKLNNVLFDRNTGKAVCVIDLDTVMPGLSLYDYGDSIRFGASTALEDEIDLDKVSVSLDLYRIYTEGYRKACPSLTKEEIETMPLGAETMTLECGMRFLTDYLEGDHYFAVHRKNQNLDRTRTQLKLVADMENKWDRMIKIAEGEEQ